ncbi:MAG: NHLP family bacteriocin export ABC transporter peptidase/permease/ATPase subunit [Armatimonadetes bacterium]|nr:NHLP family bacteriocin export ABC transporter peptidase/permease/ATPase subunit [Armatimonadota bacterium]
MRMRRARTATILQMDPMEAGAVALGLVLGYYGRFVPAEELRTACGVSRDGSHPDRVLAAAQSYGMTAELLDVAPEGLDKLQPPFLAVMADRHFVVIEGVLRHRILVNDPAVGPGRIPHATFNETYSGQAIRLEPGPSFQRGGVAPSVYRALHTRLAGFRPGVVYAILASLALVVPQLAIPVFSQVFIDHLLARSPHWLLPILGGLLVTGTIQALLMQLRNLTLERLFVGVAVESTASFFNKLLRLPMAFYSQRDIGDICGRVELNVDVAEMLASRVAVALISSITGFFVLIMMWMYDAKLTVITVMFAGFNFLALRAANRARVVQNQRLIGGKSKLMEMAYAGLVAVASIRASASENEFFARWSAIEAGLINTRQRLNYSTMLLTAMPQAVSSLTTVTILFIGGKRVMEGQMSVGSLVAFTALASSFADPISQFVRLGQQLQTTVAEMLRLDDVMQNGVDTELAPRSLEADRFVKLDGRLELRDVTFGYDPNLPPAVSGVSFVLEPGKQIALVGATGSAKSTVGKLICGLFQPWSGEILVDGRPRSEWPRATLASSLALVDQETRLFRGSVAQNLSMWDDSIPRTRLVEAARDADIHELIAGRPGGYDGVIDEGGTNLSGGQRQRMEIARALALEPTILVLDEATSALDTRTEMEVVRALRRRGCSCVVIAHRLSTVRDCDEILVLESGKVVQRGTHEQLVAIPGPYQDLIKSD